MADYPEIYEVLKSDTFDQWRIKHNLLIDAFDILYENAGDPSNLSTAAKSIVDAANELYSQAKTNESNIGDLSQLQTVDTDNLVIAINSLKQENETLIGDLANLITDDISNIVAAINSIDLVVGKKKDLATEDNSNIVNALAKLTARVGDLTQLQVDNGRKETVVDAINNVLEKIGGKDLTQLQTTSKTSLINAINELVSRLNVLDARIQNNEDNIGKLNELKTNEKTNVVASINELSDKVGQLSLLQTKNKSSMVAALNEIHTEIGDRTTLTTDHKDTLVGAINEINTWKKNSDGDLYFTGNVAIGKDVATEKLDVNGTVKANKFIGDVEGNVKGNVIGNVTGDVSGTSSRWANPITLTLSGDVAGSVSFDGSKNVTLNTSFPGGPYSKENHNHDDRYVKLSDKKSGVYVNVRNTGNTTDPDTAKTWAHLSYPESSFMPGDFLFVDRKWQWSVWGYSWYQRNTFTEYYKDIWIKFDTGSDQWMLISTTMV